MVVLEGSSVGDLLEQCAEYQTADVSEAVRDRMDKTQIDIGTELSQLQQVATMMRTILAIPPRSAASVNRNLPQ